MAVGTLGTLVMTASWQMMLLWGVVIGTGSGIASLVMGAVVANRWFIARRGLVMGLLTASFAAGQLIFLPLLAAHRHSPRLALGHRADHRGGPVDDPGGRAVPAGLPEGSRPQALRRAAPTSSMRPRRSG